MKRVLFAVMGILFGFIISLVALRVLLQGGLGGASANRLLICTGLFVALPTAGAFAGAALGKRL